MRVESNGFHNKMELTSHGKSTIEDYSNILSMSVLRNTSEAGCRREKGDEK